jgi:hypothetical protein
MYFCWEEKKERRRRRKKDRHLKHDPLYMLSVHMLHVVSLAC